jgi:3D (Asp-Asp-Asp) domain-containing protein
VEERTETVSRDLPYGTIYCNDPSLPVGTEELLVPGICGRQDTVISATYVNGAQTAVSVMGSTPTEEAVSQIVAIGTGEHVGQPRKYPLFGDNLIVTASGECLYYAYADIYEATAYSAWIDDVSDTTACGTKARVGAVAVDPRVIPYFTKMYIVTQDGAYDYGIASAEDCGGAVKGKIIDLYFDTLAECVQFGRRDIVVYFLTDQPV